MIYGVYPSTFLMLLQNDYMNRAKANELNHMEIRHLQDIQKNPYNLYHTKILLYHHRYKSLYAIHSV